MVIYTATLKTKNETTLKDMSDGELALVIDGEFEGEIFYKNVAGIHSITNNRFWPSDYLNHKIDGLGWHGPLETPVRVLKSGDVLTIKSS